MIVADEALCTKRRPSDLLYASLLLESIDEPPEVNRIQNAWMMIRVCMTRNVGNTRLFVSLRVIFR